MKKVLFIAIFSLSFAVISNAQIGVKAGMNFAKMSGFNLDNEKILTNIHAGVFMDKDIIPLLNLRFGLNYSPKGFKYDVDSENYGQGTFNYIEIPVLAKVKLGPLYALGGFYGAYALNGKFEWTELGEDGSEDVNFSDDEISQLDYGMMFGLGMQIGLGPLHVFGQVDYSYGLKNLNTGDGDDIKNSVIGVSVGVLIGM